MAKQNDPCNSNNVPDETLVDQVEQIDNMIYWCGSRGGSLEIRVVYGCGEDPGKNRRGDSNRIKWPPAGSEIQPIGGLPVGGWRSDADKAYLAEQLRKQMEAAEKDATRGCPGGTDTSFAVQGFCKGSDGRPITRPGVPNESLPPFVPTKPPTE